MSRKLFKKFSILILIHMLIFSSCTPVFAENKVSRPNISAQGAIVYCENTGEIVYSKNMNKRLAPFSVTKLMTVMLAVHNLPLDKEVTVSKEAASQPWSSMNLKEGETLTVEDLVYGAMLPSGNDAAYALGQAVSGSMDEFVKLMNRTASNIGCDNTNFVNPNGIKAKKHYTSAYDMMQIVKVALSDEIVKEAAGKTKYTVKKTNKHKERNLRTHIKYLKNENSGIYAAKTGFWDEYNATIAFGYKKNGLSLYVVLLGDTEKGRSEDVDKLLQYAVKKVEGIKVIGKDKETGKVRIKHGAKTSLQTYTAETGFAFLPKEASESLISKKTVMNDVTAPVKAGDVVGKFQIYAADELVNEVDLIVKEDVDAGWFPSYLGISNLTTLIIAAVVLLLLITIIVVSSMRANYRRKKKKLRQQKIIELAMEQVRQEQEHNERDWRF